MEKTGAANKPLILAAMIFAVSMTLIEMTIVAIAVVVNGYLLSLSALFALGGRQVQRVVVPWGLQRVARRRQLDFER
jgi:hypothetical protein